MLMNIRLKKNKIGNNFSYQPENFKSTWERTNIDIPNILAMNIISHYNVNLDQRIRDFWTHFSNFGWNFQATEALK